MGRSDAPLQPDIQLMDLGIQVKLSEKKKCTSMGRPDPPIQPDIQVMGLGIQVTKTIT